MPTPSSKPTSTDSTGSSSATTQPVQPQPTGGPTGNDPTPQHQAAAEGKRTYHDALTGAQVTETGEFCDASRAGTGPVPAHRIVADDWPQVQKEADGLVPISQTDATVQRRMAEKNEKDQ